MEKETLLGHTLNFAAIDIGSNAVRLLIKGVEPGNPPAGMRKVQLVRVPLRLGEDVFGQGAISEIKVQRLTRLVKSFKLLMKVYGVTAYRACATSAMRDAANGKKIVKHIFDKTGIWIEIVSGQEEARIVYDSHIADLLDREKDYIYVDVGGGSTEISLLSGGEFRESGSFNIGTVRMLEGKVLPSDLAAENRYLDKLARNYPQLHIIGSGGNINKLYRLAFGDKRSRTEYLSVSALEELYATLERLTVAARMTKFGLNRDRADVIVPAAEIFLNIAHRVGASRIFVPTIGISDGITHSLYSEYLRKNGE